MSIDKLTEAELLQLAQNVNSISNKEYDSGKSSIHNYAKMNKFKMGELDDVPFRVPLDLAYMHYKDWLTKSYPHILAHTPYNFNKEIIDYFNHIFVKNVCYLLIRNCAQFRTYKHPYNDFLKERTRKKYNAWQRINR